MARPHGCAFLKTETIMQLHRATSDYEPIPISSSRHRLPGAVYGGGEAHSLSVSDAQADRDVLLP
jgi:hypothetical protein